MSEYLYSRELHIWYDLNDRPFQTDYKTGKILKIYTNKLLSPEKVESLRHARQNGQYIILDNRRTKVRAGSDLYYTRKRYPGLNTDYIYQDIGDFKLLLNGHKLCLLMFSGAGFSAQSRIKLSDIINSEILKPDLQDFNVVTKYVEDNAWSDLRCPNKYFNLIQTDEEAKMEAFKKRAKLYYDDLDEEAKLVYNLIGHYGLSN